MNMNGFKKKHVRIRMVNMVISSICVTRKEGELPTNWRSYFGGPVWEDLPGTNKTVSACFP